MDNSPVILFDGVCNLCNNAVQFIIRHDKKEIFKFTSLQSESGKQLMKHFGLPSDDLFSFILVQDNKAHLRSTAALTVARQLQGPVKLLYGFILVPRFIRDAVYKFIATNRYKWFGRKDACMIPAPGLNDRFLN